MLFFLTMKKVVVACTTEKPTIPRDDPNKEQIRSLDAWTESDFICKNLVMNGLTDELYDYYRNMNHLAAHENLIEKDLIAMITNLM